MSILLEFILQEKRTIDDLRAMVNVGYSKIPLFEKMTRLMNLTLYDHLVVYQKIMGLEFADLHKAGAINIEEKQTNGQTLLQAFIARNELHAVKFFLGLGAQLSESDFALCQSDEMRNFFNYRPGAGQPRILEFCIGRRQPNYLEKIEALLFDEANSSAGDSSEAETLSSDFLNGQELAQLNQIKGNALYAYNNGQANRLNENPLCLVAARGVHFSPKYFDQETIEHVKNSRHLTQTTYSQSTLFDAGYSADDSPSEDDEKIVVRHNYNNYFIEQLKVTPDFREKKIGNYTPPSTRNNRKFDSAYYRFMQIYINSYGTLFNKGSILVDFNFGTLNNPVVSASWKIEKGAMYGSGARISSSKCRDPHYRLFTGKPKHPNAGYLDLFVFDIEYAKTHGFDRTLQCAQGKIDLSSMFRHEAEVIFNSMIPKRFHEHRCILTLPSFDKPYVYNEQYFRNYGILSSGTYNAFKRNLNKPKTSKEYKDNIKAIAEKASDGQASIIKQTLDCRLFRRPKPKVVVFDHGNRLESTPFTI